jgi:hypothetical protein
MGSHPYRIDPGVAHERAVKAGRSRTGVDYHIRKLVESAPALNAEQAAQLRALLPAIPGRTDSDPRPAA